VLKPNRFSLYFAVLAVLTPAIHAKNKKAPPPPPKDEIEVVGHIPLADGPVTRFLTTQHFSSYYLYAEHGTAGKVTLIDVSKTGQPLILGDVSYASGNGTDSLTAVAGTAALVTSAPSATAPVPPPQALRIMDFSDPRNPKIAREFTGVTAMSRDDRGLTFLANSDGIWILRQHLAEDPELDKAYANYVLYGSSMYPPGR
jgi:hypothetical protein